MPDINTHEPIELIPGLDLMVRADFMDDADVQRLASKLREIVRRDDRMREVLDAVDDWEARSCDGELEGLLEVLGPDAVERRPRSLQASVDRRRSPRRARSSRRRCGSARRPRAGAWSRRSPT